MTKRKVDLADDDVFVVELGKAAASLAASHAELLGQVDAFAEERIRCTERKAKEAAAAKAGVAVLICLLASACGGRKPSPAPATVPGDVVAVPASLPASPAPSTEPAKPEPKPSTDGATPIPQQDEPIFRTICHVYDRDEGRDPIPPRTMTLTRERAAWHLETHEDDRAGKCQAHKE